jgi:hypothetical protein
MKKINLPESLVFRKSLQNRVAVIIGQIIGHISFDIYHLAIDLPFEKRSLFAVRSQAPALQGGVFVQ